MLWYSLLQKKFNQKVYSKPIITNENITIQTPTIDDLTKNVIGSENQIGNADVNIIQPPADDNSASRIVSTPVEARIDDKPLTWAQVMPEYPGGIEALKKFMLRNLKQPDNLQPGEKIVVKATFIVNKQGEIEQVKIIGSGRDDLDEEVKRVINKMPLWRAGMQNGNAVAVYFNLPVTFMSEEE